MTQDQAFNVLTMGKHAFLTGPAGTGKTYVLNRYIRWLRERGIEPAVTASTGIAATHLHGQTIHSWSGVGVKEHLGSYDIDKLEQNEKLFKRFSNTKVLVIDEVSMLSGNTLSLVDQSIRTVLRTAEPFGGMQVVLCGDFFQLPPVVRGGGDADFAFQGAAWHSLALCVCYLEEQYRQDDETLLALLSAIRAGNVPRELVAALEARQACVPPEDIPHLYTHNVDVDKQNVERLAALPGGFRSYDMQTKGAKKYLEPLRRGVLAPEVLQLKEGAAVMFVKNHPQGRYVNGTLGTVCGFSAMGDPEVETRDGRTIVAEPESWAFEEGGKVRAEVTQVPLRLAWAITVHKSQGMTLDAARMDLRKTFVPGQGYVALSRVRALEGLFLDGVNELAFARHPAVAEADTFLAANAAAVVRRLEKTHAERIAELSQAFVERSGGHPPDPKKANAKPRAKETTQATTLRLLREGKTLEEVAEERERTLGTIISHLEQLQRGGMLAEDDVARIRPQDEGYEEVLVEIRAAFKKVKTDTLTPAFKQLKGAYTFDELRLARLFLAEGE